MKITAKIRIVVVGSIYTFVNIKVELVLPFFLRHCKLSGTSTTTRQTVVTANCGMESSRCWSRNSLPFMESKSPLLHIQDPINGTCLEGDSSPHPHTLFF